MDPHFHGVIFKTHSEELARRMGYPFPPFAILDVRSPDAYRAGHIPGARSVSPEALAQGFPEGTSERTEFFVVGEDLDDSRTREASLALKKLGARRIVELTGGMLEWRLAGLPVEVEGNAAVEREAA